MTCNLDAHIAKATAVRFDPNFVKIPAQDLVALIDCVIECARAGVTMTEAERDGLKPFCGAADANAGNRSPVALRCEDYYHLVQLAQRVQAARGDLTPLNTTPAPWTTTLPPDLPAVDFLQEPPPKSATAAADPQPQELAATAAKPKKLRPKSDAQKPTP